MSGFKDKPAGTQKLTKDMAEKLKMEIDSLEGKEIIEGGKIQLDPNKRDPVAWYIAYKT